MLSDEQKRELLVQGLPEHLLERLVRDDEAMRDSGDECKCGTC